MIGPSRRMEDRHDDVGSRAACRTRPAPLNVSRLCAHGYGAKPRIATRTPCAEDGDLVAAAPAQPVVGECSQGLLLADAP